MLQLPNYKLIQFVQMYHNTFFAAISLQREHPYPLRAAWNTWRQHTQYRRGSTPHRWRGDT